MRRAHLVTEHFASLVANDVTRAARARSVTRDAQIAIAASTLASRVTEAWTVAKLAKLAGLSRAAFARRFVAALGVPPLRHLAALRMTLTSTLLLATDASLAEIAARVGYANEFALSRAFRRLVGTPPATFRRRARESSSFATRCAA